MFEKVPATRDALSHSALYDSRVKLIPCAPSGKSIVCVASRPTYDDIVMYCVGTT